MRACELVVVVATVQILIRYGHCARFNAGEHKQRSAFEIIEAANSVSNEDIFYGDEKFINKANPFEYEIQARAVMSNLAKRWQDAVVPYRLSSGYKPAEKIIIVGAMREMEDSSCVRFFPYDISNPQKDFLFIKKISGCWSYVGRIGGQQDVSLTSACVTESIIQHELLHALGIWHEQSRPDRDNYVRILRKNIRGGKESNFDKNMAINSLGIEYDPVSIMHYHRTAFSNNGKNTIEWKTNPKRELGGTLMTSLDIKQLNQLYECGNIPVTARPTTKPTTTTTKTTVTKRTTTTQKTTIKPITGCNISGTCRDKTYLCSTYNKQNSLDCSYQLIRNMCSKTCGCC